jgi:hypothetical protein
MSVRVSKNSQYGYAMLESAALMLVLTPVLYFSATVLQSVAQQSDMKDVVHDLVHTEVSCGYSVRPEQGTRTSCNAKALVEKIDRYAGIHEQVGCQLLEVLFVEKGRGHNQVDRYQTRETWGIYSSASHTRLSKLINGNDLSFYIDPQGTGLHARDQSQTATQLLHCEVCNQTLKNSVGFEESTECTGVLGEARGTVMSRGS